MFYIVKYNDDIFWNRVSKANENYFLTHQSIVDSLLELHGKCAYDFMSIVEDGSGSFDLLEDMATWYGGDDDTFDINVFEIDMDVKDLKGKLLLIDGNEQQTFSNNDEALKWILDKYDFDEDVVEELEEGGELSEMEGLGHLDDDLEELLVVKL